MMQTLDYQERIIFALRNLYGRYGYRPYKMNKFEEYDLYARNKDFLISDHVIAFTDTNGRLMALKPDVTLSIVKNTADAEVAVQKLYYNETVYRVSKGSQAFREMMQVGLECLGEIDDYCITEVLLLAAKSLQQISPNCVLDISHLGLVTELLEEAGLPEEAQAEAFKVIGEKNFHELEALCRRSGVSDESIRLLQTVFSLSGSIPQVLPQLTNLLSGSSFARFRQILTALEAFDTDTVFRIDFSVVDNIHYYNGFVFKGFVSGIPSSVLSGGQYDKLMKKMRRSSGAVGFAVYIDALERLSDAPAEYDADTVLLYPKDAPVSAVCGKVKELTAQGCQVLALSALPEQLRYRTLCELEVTDFAENT